MTVTYTNNLRYRHVYRLFNALITRYWRKLHKYFKTNDKSTQAIKILIELTKTPVCEIVSIEIALMKTKTVYFFLTNPAVGSWKTKRLTLSIYPHLYPQTTPLYLLEWGLTLGCAGHERKLYVHSVYL